MQRLKTSIYLVLAVILCILISFFAGARPAARQAINIISGDPALNPHSIDSIISYMAYYGYTDVAVTFSNVKNNTLLPSAVTDTANLLLRSNLLAKDVFERLDITILPQQHEDIAVARISATVAENPTPQSIVTASTSDELYNIITKNFKNDIFRFYIQLSDTHTAMHDLNLMLKSAADNTIFWQNPTALHISEPFKNLLYIDVEFDDDLAQVLSNKHLVLSMKNLIAERCGITEGMTARQRIAKIHETILSTIVYNRDLESAINSNSLNSEYRLLNSAYGALIQSSTACMGYSQAVKLLCDHFGIECYTVSGSVNDIGHMWNIVNVDGEYMYLDSTLADVDNPSAVSVLFPNLRRGGDVYIPSTKMYHPLGKLPGVEYSDNTEQKEDAKVQLVRSMW